MNTEIEKKEYIAPQMTVVDMECTSSLLECSQDCGYGFQSLNDEGESLD